MHDDDVGLCAAHALAIETPVPEVFAHRREKGFAHPLKLDTQHHDHICAFDRFIHRMGDVNELVVLAHHLLHSRRH